MLSPPSLLVACAVNIDHKLNAIRIMEKNKNLAATAKAFLALVCGLWNKDGSKSLRADDF